MSPPGFRRLILELGHGAADLDTIQAAAGFARVMDLELLALFIEDEALPHAAALPFAREISPLTYRWRPMEVDRLASDLRAAADKARQTLEAVAKDVGIDPGFEVRRGDPGEPEILACVETDIVVLSAARRREGEAVHGLRRLIQTAHGSAASVLWLPPGAVADRGPVAVAADDGDPAGMAARRIADRAGEKLVRVSPAPGDSLTGFIAALDELNERLIVLSRAGPWGEAGAALAAQRGVPVLVVE